MFSTRSTIIAAALALAVGLSVSLLPAAAPAGGGAATATAPAKVGSVSGKVLDKDGKAATGATIRVAATTPATAPAGGAAGGGRGGRGGRGPTTMTGADGAFKLEGVAVGQVNVTASLMNTTDNTYQAGTTAAPVEIKENAETKLADPIKMVTATAPARAAAEAARAALAARVVVVVAAPVAVPVAVPLLAARRLPQVVDRTDRN